jgi:predicted O-methyltransferase YrrM
MSEAAKPDSERGPDRGSASPVGHDSQQRWTAVDEYVAARLLASDSALESAVRASADAGLPAIAVSPPQGKLLHLLARLHGSRTILELGTLGGYSTIWLARALPPGGRLVTIEAEPSYARVAAENIERAGLGDIVELRVGPALEQLPELAAEEPAPFDLVFIDADKQTTPEYFSWALELTRPGSVIVTDNVIRAGALIDPDCEDPRVEGMRRFHELLAAEPRVSATTIQTVGSKGYDGFTVALVTAGAHRS